ncbi:MAG: sulfotransferase domain-containing protein, partial [Gammaproteobacteria bacterium]
VNQLELDEKAQAGELETEPVEGKPVIVDYRIFINGFPKAGTHLVEQYIKPICPPMKTAKPWAGSFSGNSWTENWVEDYHLFRNIGWLGDGQYCKGHMGYRRDIEMFLWGIGATVLFVYRDPRDVAVSQVNHILRGGFHPEPEPFKELVEREGFKAGLKWCIEGWQGEKAGPAGPNYYSGVIARWKYYAPWLYVPWVLSLRFENLIHKREEMAELICRACVGRAALHRGYVARIPSDVLAQSVEHMVEFTHKTDKSPTFYKGTSGQWQEYFDDELKALWKQHDPVAPLPPLYAEMAQARGWQELQRAVDAEPQSWLVRLGYEKSEEW